MVSRRRTRKNPWRRALLLLVSAIVALGLLLRTEWAQDQTCRLLRRQLERALGLEVGIDRCEIDPLSQTLSLHGFRAASGGSQTPVLAADRAEIGLRGIFATSIAFRHVTVSRPQVVLDRSRPASGGGASSCPLKVFERVQIDRLDVRGADVRVKLPDGVELEVSDLEVGWTVRRNVAEVRVDSQRGVVRLSERELLMARLSAEGELDVDDESFELTRGELALDEASVSLSGTIDALCEPVLSLEGQLFVPMAAVARAAGMKEPVGGQVWSRVSLSGRADHPVVQLDLAGSGVAVGDYSPGDFRARVSLKGDEVQVSQASFAVGTGAVKASGSLKLSPQLPLRVRLETENASFARILERVGVPGAWVDFPATARGSLAGTLAPLHLTGEADVKSGPFVVRTKAFDAPPEVIGRTVLSFASGRAAGRVAVLSDRVELTGLRISSGRTVVSGDVKLYYDEDRGLDIDARADEVDLSDFGHIAEQHVAGQGSTRFRVVGPYDDVRVDAQVSLRDFEYWHYALGVVQGRITYADGLLSFPAVSAQKGKTTYFGQVGLKFDGDEVSTRLKIDLPSGRLEDVIDVVAPLHPSLEASRGVLLGEASGSVELSGPKSKLGGRVTLEMKNVTYHGRRLGQGRLGLRFVDGRSMVLEDTRIAGPAGTFRIDGAWSFAGPLDYRFRFDDVSLAELAGPERAKALGITGTLTSSGRVDGDSTTPVTTAYVTSPRVTFAGKPLGSMHLEMRMQGRELHLWGRPFNDATATLKMRVKEPYPYDARFELSLPEIRPLLPEGAISQGLSGSVAGSGTVSGQLEDAKTVRASATLTKLTLSRGDFQGRNDRPVTVSYEAGRVRVDSFGFVGPNTHLQAQGHYGPKDADFAIHGALDVRLLESFVPQLERTAGRIEVTATVTGPIADPSVVGRVELNDARLSVRDRGITLRQLSGQVEFSAARVLVHDVAGVLNDGSMRLRGDIRLAGFDVKQLEIAADLVDVSYRPIDELPVVASGTLILYGKPGALQLSGGIDLVKLRYEKSLTLESFLKGVRQAHVGFSSAQPREWLRFDVDIAATEGDVRVDNDLANARLFGKVKLTGTNVRPGLIGSIEAADGSMAYFRGNPLQILKGVLQFKDTSSIDAFVDFNAQARVREYLVNVKAFGRLSDPKVVLSSDPQLPEADILSLLTLGVTSRDRGLSSQAGAGLALEAFLSATGMNRQVQRYLPRSSIIRDVQFNLSTTLNPASGLVEPAMRFESKILTERLILSVTQPVSGRGTSAQAEYWFTHRVSGRVQWDNENQDYSFGNPGLDLKLKFEWE